MNNNELRARLLIEAADLLGESEQESLNEGIGLALFGGFVGIVSLSALILSIYEKIKKLKMGRKMTEVNKYRSMFFIELNKIISKVKFIKYKKNVLPALNELIPAITNYGNKVMQLDNKFESIKTCDEYYKKKQFFDTSYKKVSDDYANKVSAINKKYLSVDSEWVEDNKILPSLKKFIELFTNMDYYRNLDGDDYYEGIYFLANDVDDEEDENNDIWEHAFDTYSICDISPFDNIDINKVFSSIKIQLTGKTIRESIDFLY